MKEWKKVECENMPKVNFMPSILDNFRLGFFDGAHKDGWCGASMILHLRRNHFFRLSTRLGHVTNTFAELMALWGILWFSRKRGILELRVVGDSKVVIDWVNGKKMHCILCHRHIGQIGFRW